MSFKKFKSNSYCVGNKHFSATINIKGDIEQNKTRRERLKSAPYLRFKKRKTLFLKKIEIFEKNFSFKRSRIVPKM